MAAQLKDLETKLDSLNSQLAQVGTNEIEFLWTNDANSHFPMLFHFNGLIQYFQVLKQESDLEEAIQTYVTTDEDSIQQQLEAKEKLSNLMARKDDITKQVGKLENDISAKEKQIAKSS